MVIDIVFMQERKKYGYRYCVQVLGWYNKM
jgi:hypothetical protein